MKEWNKEEFKQWLVGFIDAEGNFQVFMVAPLVNIFELCFEFDFMSMTLQFFIELKN